MVKKILVALFYIFLLMPAQAQKDSSIVELGYPFETPPTFCGDLRLYIQNKLEYPISALKDSIEGTIHVSYKVDTCGKTYDHYIEKGIREDLNTEALRVAKGIVYTKPAYYSGKPTIFYFTLPIRFSFKKDTILKKIE